MGIRNPISPRFAAQVSIPPDCDERYVPLEHPLLGQWRRLGVVHSGLSRLVRGYRISIPKLTRLMVIVTTADGGSLENPDTRHELDPGSVYVGVPGEPVRFRCRRPGWRMLWWYLRPDPGWRLPGRGWLQRCPQAPLLEGAAADLLGRLVPSAATPDAVAAAEAALLLASLRELLQPVLATALAEPSPDAIRLESLWRHVEERLALPWSVDHLARRAGCSPATLQRLVRRQHGCSVHQALIERRIALAQRLLAQTDYPLQVIAERVGYGDAFTLSAVFRQRTGMPPSRWRREQQGG